MVEKTITIRISDSIRDTINDLLTDHKTVSDIVRDALELYCSNHKLIDLKIEDNKLKIKRLKLKNEQFLAQKQAKIEQKEAILDIKEYENDIEKRKDAAKKKNSEYQSKVYAVWGEARKMVQADKDADALAFLEEAKQRTGGLGFDIYIKPIKARIVDLKIKESRRYGKNT